MHRRCSSNLRGNRMLRVPLLRIAAMAIALLLSTEATNAQAPTGLAEIQGRFASLPTGAALRIIAQINVNQARINVVGKTNATSASADSAIQSVQQLGVLSVRKIVGTDYVAMSLTSDQLNRLVALNIVRSVYTDHASATTLPDRTRTMRAHGSN
jgi:hypothetical protein